MIAPYLKERWGWIDTDRCWWCDREDRVGSTCSRSVVHGRTRSESYGKRLGTYLGKGKGRKGQTSPSRVGRVFGIHVRQARARPSNITVRELLSNSRYTEAVLDFLGKTRVGEVKEGVICR